MYTTAGFADLVYYREPEIIVERIDLRAESISHKVARYKYTMIIPANQTAITATIDKNLDVKQIVLKTPIIVGTPTTVLTIGDEIGAVLYTSAAKAHDGTYVLLSAVSFIPLVGRSYITATLGASVASPTTIIVLIYGT